MKIKTIRKKIGYAPVDSGQVMLVDPSYVLEKRQEEIKSYKEFLEDTEAKGIYDNHKNGVGVSLEKGNDFEHGVVVTGFGGDGIYPVTVETIDGMTKSVTITFIQGEEV